MSRQSVTPNDSKALQDLRGDAYDTATLAVCCMDNVGSLFEAIKNASAENTLPYRLAFLGSYLAEDFMNTFDLESGKYIKPEAGESTLAGVQHG